MKQFYAVAAPGPAQLNYELSPLDAAVLEHRTAQARDAVTRWAALTLSSTPGREL